MASHSQQAHQDRLLIPDNPTCGAGAPLQGEATENPSLLNRDPIADNSQCNQFASTPIRPNQAKPALLDQEDWMDTRPSGRGNNAYENAQPENQYGRAPSSMDTQAVQPPQQQSVIYICGECHTENVIKGRDPIRCGACGYRIMYKKRTNRPAVFDAR